MMGMSENNSKNKRERMSAEKGQKSLILRMRRDVRARCNWCDGPSDLIVDSF